MGHDPEPVAYWDAREDADTYEGPEADPMDAWQTPEGGHPYRLTVNFDADSLLHAQLLVSLIEKTVRKSLSTRPDFVFEELDVQPGAEVLLPQFGQCAADQVVLP